MLNCLISISFYFDVLNNPMNETAKKIDIDLTLPILTLWVLGYLQKKQCYIFMKKRVCEYDILFVTILFIFGLGFYYHSNKIDDPLNKQIFNCQDCDSWMLLHFLLYFVLGLMFPKRHMLFLIIGILWEVYEQYNGKYNITFMGLSSNRGTKNDDMWWYGRSIDVAANCAGYILGDYLISKYSHSHK